MVMSLGLIIARAQRVFIMERVYIPRYLEERERVLIFELRDILFLFAGFGIGITFGQVIAGILFGIALVMGGRYLKRKGIFKVLRNFLYWNLPFWGLRLFIMRFEATPPSYIRVFSG